MYRQQASTSDLDLMFGFGSPEEATDFIQTVLSQPTDFAAKVPQLIASSHCVYLTPFITITITLNYLHTFRRPMSHHMAGH